jgi:hypothetical protein
MKQKALFHFKITTQCVLVCLVATVAIGCQKKNHSDEVLPGRHMSESHAYSLALAVLPPLNQPRGFMARFTNGVWEITAFPGRLKNGKPVLADGFPTNETVVARVRDTDGKVDIVNSP